MSPTFCASLRASELLDHSALCQRKVSKDLIAQIKDQTRGPFDAVKVVCNLRGPDLILVLKGPEPTRSVVARLRVPEEDLDFVRALFERKPMPSLPTWALTPPSAGKVTACDVMQRLRRMLALSAPSRAHDYSSIERVNGARVLQAGYCAACSLLVGVNNESLTFWEKAENFVDDSGDGDVENAISHVLEGVGVQLQAACARNSGVFFLNSIIENLPKFEWSGVNGDAVSIPAALTAGLLTAIDAGLRDEVCQVLEHFFDSDRVLQARIVTSCISEALESDRAPLFKDVCEIANRLFGDLSDLDDISLAVRTVLCFELVASGYFEAFDQLFNRLSVKDIRLAAVGWSFGFRIGSELKTRTDGLEVTDINGPIELIEGYFDRLNDSDLVDEILPNIAAGIIAGARDLASASIVALLDHLQLRITSNSESARALWKIWVLQSLGVQHGNQTLSTEETRFVGAESLAKAQAFIAQRPSEREPYLFDLVVAVDSWLVINDKRLSGHIKDAVVEDLRSPALRDAFPTAKMQLADRFYRAGECERAFAILPRRIKGFSGMKALWNLRQLARDTNCREDALQIALDRKHSFGWIQPQVLKAQTINDNYPLFLLIEEAAAHGLWKEVLLLIGTAQELDEHATSETAGVALKTVQAVFKGLLRFHTPRKSPRQ